MIQVASRHTTGYCLDDWSLSSHLIRKVKNLSRPHNHQFIMLVVFLKDFKLVLAQFRVRLALSCDSPATQPSTHLDIVCCASSDTLPLSKSPLESVKGREKNVNSWMYIVGLLYQKQTNNAIYVFLLVSLEIGREKNNCPERYILKKK